MRAQNPFWFLFNVYGWVIFAMSLITAIIFPEVWWVIFLGVSGYLVALLVDLIGGGNLGRTGAVRLARVEQENRELRAEQARLLGAIQERDAKLTAQAAQPAAPPAPPPVAPPPAK